MAPQTLFSSAASNLFCHPNSRKPDPFATQSLVPEHKLQSRWLAITKLSLLPSNVRPVLPKTRTIAAIVTSSLSTANTEQGTSTDKIPKWSSKAIKSYAMGELEARKLKYPTTGTEAILMGIMIEGTNRASKFLRANGVTLSKVREEAMKVLGKSDVYYFSPEHPPLTESAQKALDWAVDEKLNSGNDGEITTSHLLLGVWKQEEAAGHKILANLGFDGENAKEVQSLISKPGFVED